MQKNMLGIYGEWAASISGEKPGSLSFRSESWPNITEWTKSARVALRDLLHRPPAVKASDIQVHRRYVMEDLDVEELSWQLPFGPRTEAILLKPRGAARRLPGVLAFHDHAGDKYFGKRKITRTRGPVHPMMANHQEHYYGGVAWANVLARSGFAVLVSDVFPFESRRILPSDLPPRMVQRLMTSPTEVRELDPEDMDAPDTGWLEVPPDEPAERIGAYNAFGGQYESTIAKSLFCAGLTWPGIVVAEDQAALEYLVSRSDVDADRIGCAGLSGGGLRTVFLAGLDERIRCAVCIGMMTTWRDFLLNTSFKHTWMIYVSGLPPLLDYPEILGLHAPLPTLVLAGTKDPLFTRAETEAAGRQMEDIYRKAGAGDCLKISHYPVAHAFDLPMQKEAFAWLDKWLSPGASS